MTQHRSSGKPVAARSASLLFEGLGAGHRIHSRHAPAPMTIWCHKPQRWTPNASVLFVMHGVRRNAGKYHKVWRKYAERHNFLLLVPEFSRQYYPNTRTYTLGTFSTSSLMLSQNMPRTYHVIEQIFDAAKALLSFRANTYFIYGHSAGAQFVHRLVLFLPDIRAEAAICANAGWYTMVSDAVGFPYGLKGSGITKEVLTRAFRKKLIILLGEQDTNPHHAHLKRSLQARAQGKHRLERGKRFYDLAVQKARDLQVPFKWELHLVHGVGHSNAHMARSAMQSLLEISRTGQKDDLQWHNA